MLPFLRVPMLLDRNSALIACLPLPYRGSWRPPGRPGAEEAHTCMV